LNGIEHETVLKPILKLIQLVQFPSINSDYETFDKSFSENNFISGLNVNGGG
jgi:hypothetical protein